MRWSDWPAFREQLPCGEQGLDDVALELTKLAVMRVVKPDNEN